MSQKFEYICSKCGEVIVSSRKKRTSKCNKCLKRERAKKGRAETSSPYHKPKHNNEDIRRDVIEIENYNKHKGTRYSYGQYKLQQFLGKI